MATPEAKASEEVVTRACDWKARLFRNNSGALEDENGRLIRFGLGNDSPKVNKELKSGDYVGWLPITITPEMVGQTLPVFTNVEVKALGFKEKLHYNKNSREYAQNNFNQLVMNHNGIAGFAYDWQSFDKMVKNFYERLYNNVK
jgi:hypothetical protein